MSTGQLFIDTGYNQCCHRDEKACGDAVSFKRIPGEERLIAVLADGLGHGLKANILALMTTTMAVRFSADDREIVHSAEIIMDSLPVCQVRQISYATFTIVDTRLEGITSIVEMGNPPFCLFRGGRYLPQPGKEFVSPKYADRAMTSYRFKAQPGDRVVFFSDGVTQAGLGAPSTPLGWRDVGVRDYIEDELADSPEMSAQELAERVLREAVAHEPGMSPADDISVVSLYFREPRRLLIFTGPPFDAGRDAECAAIFRDFPGEKVVAGGTSAAIVSRELGTPLELDLAGMSGDLPPESHMSGADLVTEGIFTLTRAARYLEDGATGRPDPAGRMVELMRTHDVIDFLVGTRVNEAHQDPNLPAELELRRSIVNRIVKSLRERYMKEVRIRFV
ncbi:MAG: SpoIIE family protein phosphatase [Victivallaceae bacterium]|nr:SpoIIE family protein phosphatase [Victivallaceae bacterium]